MGLPPGGCLSTVLCDVRHWVLTVCQLAVDPVWFFFCLATKMASEAGEGLMSEVLAPLLQCICLSRVDTASYQDGGKGVVRTGFCVS